MRISFSICQDRFTKGLIGVLNAVFAINGYASNPFCQEELSSQKYYFSSFVTEENLLNHVQSDVSNKHTASISETNLLIEDRIAADGSQPTSHLQLMSDTDDLSKLECILTCLNNFKF